MNSPPRLRNEEDTVCPTCTASTNRKNRRAARMILFWSGMRVAAVHCRVADVQEPEVHFRGDTIFLNAFCCFSLVIRRLSGIRPSKDRQYVDFYRLFSTTGSKKHDPSITHILMTTFVRRCGSLFSDPQTPKRWWIPSSRTIPMPK